MHDVPTTGLSTARLTTDPYPLLASLRDRHPVWRVPRTDAFLVTSWDLVAEATGRVDEFSNHFRHTIFTAGDGTMRVVDGGESGAPDVFAGADPPDHTAHRRLFFPELVQARMRELEPVVAARTDVLLDEALASGRFDAATALADPLPLRIMAEDVMGLRDVDVGWLQARVDAGSHVMGGRRSLDGIATAAEDAAALWPWVADQLDEARRSRRSDGVLGPAAAAVSDGGLDPNEAVFTLIVLLGAGAETTTSLIGNAVRLVAEHGELQDRLRSRLELVPTYVEEVLRVESPFRFHPRLVRGPTTLGDVELPDRAMLLLMWSSANRDGEVFEDPDTVVVGRPNAHLHLGFGRGIHHCVGAPLARLETRVVLERLLERTGHVELDPTDAPTNVDSIWINRHEHLPVATS